MPIFVQCPCGKNFTVPEEQRGKRFKCYICGGDLVAGSHDESSEAIAAQPSGADPASCLPTASHLADDPAAELGRRRQKLRRCTALVGRLEIGCMLAGAVLCLGSVTLAYVGARFAKAPGNTYDMGMGPVLLGAFMFVWGFSRWLRRWLR